MDRIVDIFVTSGVVSLDRTSERSEPRVSDAASHPRRPRPI
jgi:hypothetical protein